MLEVRRLCIVSFLMADGRACRPQAPSVGRPWSRSEHCAEKNAIMIYFCVLNYVLIVFTIDNESRHALFRTARAVVAAI
jgi:hypothetical protein